ncbi:rap guanine nucleotide exchange factor 6-like isoform X3 [Ornithodoros turicata]|uniref:rap guanine nucleotide exchange factor 6-like isoform X3 n=1 Tax=Ornithodoros turicata TaxID=34597 RepID=UPI00313928FB
MAGYNQQEFVAALRKPPEGRSRDDLKLIYSYLHMLEALSALKEASIRALCKTVRYSKREANDILYCRGELSTCWYILLSGSVFINGSMYLPRSSFGKRSGGTGRRMNECLILEPSEMVVIDYPDCELLRPGQRQSCTTMNLERLLALEPDEVTVETRHRIRSDASDHMQQLDSQQTVLQRDLKSNRSSRSSDTSSAYSGSDTMQSVQSSLEDNEVDLTGLMESNVDSDEEEDLAESMDSLTVRDTYRECLEKDPNDRTEDDIETLLEFMQPLPAFANMTLSVRRELCAVMVFAVVEKAGTVVMNDGEELDSWSVIVNGQVEVDLPDGNIKELAMGDSFGITPTMEKMHHQGTMRTKVDDCQFVCIAQGDYYRILHRSEENTWKVEENGQVVLVTEHRSLDGGSREGHVVIRGTPERLLSQLLEENGLDPGYIEDFLLTYRTFIPSSTVVTSKLLSWFKDPSLRDKVTRVVLLWVNNHFTDFETDPDMMEFLELFEQCLEAQKMHAQLRLLNLACATKARTRVVTLARSSRDDVLPFQILGGYESGNAIFVAKVDKTSKSEDGWLKRGDEILEVNGQSFATMSHSQALEILRKATHLSITVRSNLLEFKEMLNNPEKAMRPRGRKSSDMSRYQPDTRLRLSSHLEWGEVVGLPLGIGGMPLGVGWGPPGSPSAVTSPHTCSHGGTGGTANGDLRKDDKKGFMTLGHRAKLKKALAKMNIIPKTLNSESHLNSSDDSLYSTHSGSSAGSGGHARTSRSGSSPAHNHGGGQLYHSHSNPDLTSLAVTHYDADGVGCRDFPEHVLKVYKADQTCKYLLVHRETTAREVVMLSLREFGITDSSSLYSLCEVSVGEGGLIKQRRLPEQMQNLAEKIGLNSRYYLKNNSSTDPLVPDDMASELLRESQVNFLHLNSVEVATQLTLEDFSIFRQIEPTEYIDDLFEVKSAYGSPMLTMFEELVNREMFWVVSEICGESNPIRRMKTVKQFVKVARQCKECKNFNSMFAILSGLGHGAVARLRSTWDKLPSKYQKMFEDLQELMDPSRNMCKYRNLINSEQMRPPVIPFYPIVRKDLTFIHYGNDTIVDNLVNFEKLRMIAKEVRQLMNMCSAPYDLYSMLEAGGSPLNPALASLNSFAATGSALAVVRGRKRSTAQPSPKKMFEEAQMVRRVKAYLSRLRVVTDESRLLAMSVDCEPHPVPPVLPVAVSQQIPRRRHPSPRKRHPSPTLSTASSNSSTSEGKKSINSGGGPKFDSPQAMRKLLALSDQSKMRPHQPSRPQPASPSPGPARRSSAVQPGHIHGHGRSRSDTGYANVQPVDLSAESSSVTSLNNLPLRKSHTSACSVTSADSGVGSYHSPHDSDSCRGSIGYDSPQQRRPSGTLPPSPPLMRARKSMPPFPHAVPVLPPISPGQLHGPLSPTSILMPPPRDPPRPRRPPDYNVAAQMARSRHMYHYGRAHSHEGVTGCYNSDATTDPEEDDEEETQVSAV